MYTCTHACTHTTSILDKFSQKCPPHGASVAHFPSTQCSTTGITKATVCTQFPKSLSLFTTLLLAGRRARALNIIIYFAKCQTYLEGRKEMFYLTTHSAHFIYGYMASDMVKDHSDSEKGNPLPPHRLLFTINSKGYFICTIPQTG